MTDKFHQVQMEAAARELLTALPSWLEVPEDHRRRTPERMVRSLLEMTTPQPFEFTTFPNAGMDEMITLGPIPFHALCAHHVLPFLGNAWVSYVPNDKVVGLSKIPRAVQEISKGLWVQEELTQTIANFLWEHLEPVGLGIVMKAEHLCMAIRGVQAPGVLTTTSAMLGAYGDHNRTAKAEFLASI